MKDKLLGFVFLLVLVAIPFFLFTAAPIVPEDILNETHADQMASLENSISDRFPASEALRRLQVSLRYWGGNQEQNGVFISGNSLMLDVQPPKDLKDANANMQAIKNFVRTFECPSYLMLIPTASAIQQDQVPRYAEFYDQKALIDEVYRRLSGFVNSIDVYPTLFSHQNEYIFYRTDNTITSLGGYYVYTAASKKLGDWRVRGLEEFDVDHLDYNYYGDLYQSSPYREISPDRVSTYIFSRYRRYYIVTHYNSDGPRRYYSLYPKWKSELGGTMDILLGGMSPVIDISVVNSQQGSRLLLFCDRSIQSYLPFLLVNYGQVTAIDTSQVTPEFLQNISVESYNQVLFAYSVDRFVLENQLSILKDLPDST